MMGFKSDPFAYAVAGSLPPFADATGRTVTSSALVEGERAGVFIIEGQSLASSHIPHAYTVTNATKVQSVNWAGDRLLYRHKEPCFGGTFFEADHIPGNNWSFPYISLWGKVGDLLIDGGVFDRVIWCNVSAGGVQVNVLAPGGVLGQRLPMAFNVLRALGIKPSQVTGIVQMIGEGDSQAGVTKDVYQGHRRASARVARSYGFTGPIFVPLETYTAGSPTQNPTISAAQAELAAEAGYALGPNFDVYGSTYRDFNGTHQNPAGHDAMAQAWFTSLAARFS